MALLPSLWDERAQSLTNLQKEMNRLFGDFSRSLPEAMRFGAELPAIDVSETEDGLAVSAELPGVSEADLDVSVEDRTLVIKGEKREEKETKDKDRHVSERVYGAFRRSLALPFAPDPDAVTAHMENGVLKVFLPKPPETAEKSRKINVTRKT